MTEAQAVATRVLTNPDLEWIFSPDALPEVSFSADVDGIAYYGTADRLIIAPDTITVIDFKSNAAVPATAKDCPEGVLRQMGAYSEMLAQIYPGRDIISGILWTTPQKYQEIPQNLVMEAFERAQRLDATQTPS